MAGRERVTEAIAEREHDGCLFVRSDFTRSGWSLKLCVG